MARTGGYPVLLGGKPRDQKLAETTITVMEVMVTFGKPVEADGTPSLSPD